MPKILLNKQNFFHNLDAIKARVDDVSQIALVLKDNAYGHGVLEVATMAVEYGIKKAVVRSQAEAMLIYAKFEYILVLGEIPQKSDAKICYTINDLTSIERFPKGTRVELKVNTGMNRNGIEIAELEEAFASIKRQGLSLEAVFTHHACADELDGVYELQKERFELLKKRLPQELRTHSCNSAALFRQEQCDEDMVRVGIAAYGCLEMPESEVALKPVLSLYASRISRKELEEKESIGYGGAFFLEAASVVSNYDIGYGDGFMRIFSHRYTTPKGAKLFGRISMDNASFIWDEEELLIFDDARVVAPNAKTISYEVLTSLKPHIKREIV